MQEIFQAVTPLFYAAPEAELAPLVLVGQEYWTDTLPVWPAVRALGQERGLDTVVHLVDTIEEAAASSPKEGLGPSMRLADLATLALTYEPRGRTLDGPMPEDFHHLQVERRLAAATRSTPGRQRR